MPEITRNPVMTAPTRDTHTTWQTNNPIIPEGVLCITKNRLYEGSVEYFVGDGIKTYTELDKFGCTGYNGITTDAKNAPTGVAGLDANAKIAKAQLPDAAVTDTDLTSALAGYQPAISILTAEPSASNLDEGEIAFVVEA